MVVEELDALRDGYGGCEVVAFADLSTQMILIADTQSNLPREDLDRLCAEAATSLGSSNKCALGEVPNRAAIVANGKAMRVFLRASTEPNDVLCCICQPELDLNRFLSDARERLDRISSDG